MYDNAPLHRAAATKAMLNEMQIICMNWPLYSPDLNPIETVWYWMKQYIMRNYPEKMTKAQLREAIQAA